ncbi:MAG TPA: hypothetical protein VFQ54_11710 [Thermomicrobiales bacterium]|nr:hypothetical protein [Thermomicrobiales bacterium]
MDDEDILIAAALVARLLDEIPACDTRPVRASHWGSDRAAARLWASLGFVRLMRTRLATLDAGMAISEPEILPTGFSILTGAELPDDGELWPRIAMLHAEIYQRNHQWSPPREIGKDLAMALFLDPDDLIRDALFVLIAEGSPVGVASLRRGGSANRCEMGWIGVELGTAALRDLAIDVLLKECLD